MSVSEQCGQCDKDDGSENVQAFIAAIGRSAEVDQLRQFGHAHAWQSNEQPLRTVFVDAQ